MLLAHCNRGLEQKPTLAAIYFFGQQSISAHCIQRQPITSNAIDSCGHHYREILLNFDHTLLFFIHVQHHCSDLIELK